MKRFKHLVSSDSPLIFKLFMLNTLIHDQKLAKVVRFPPESAVRCLKLENVTMLT